MNQTAHEHGEMRDPPEEFVENVRQALLSLYDPSALQQSPLLADSAGATGSVVGIQRFRRTLLDTINLFHPKHGVPSVSRAWRIYRILELRYIERNDVADVIAQIALSKSQYHREHHYALQAVSRLLWKDWQSKGINPSISSSDTSIARPPDTLLQSEVDSLRQAPVDVRTSPVEVLRGIDDLLRPLCRRSGKILQLEIADNLPSLPCDRVTLRQALLPLLMRTINSTQSQQIRVGVSHRDDWVDVVIDGVPSESTQIRHLMIEDCRPFVELLGGALAFQEQPTPTAHTSIRLSLPVDVRATLLVVDNHPNFADFVARCLVGQKWDVIGVGEVDQAFLLAEARQPQAIVLDVIIPGRDGWDLLARLKESRATREIPVIICSILDEPEIALTLGAAGYLRKPVDRDHLTQTLERVKLVRTSPELSETTRY